MVTIIERIILPFIVGLIIGGIFSFLKLPVPTPDKIEGVIGVIGIFIGMFLVKTFF